MKNGSLEELTKTVSKLYKRHFSITQIADIIEIPVEKVKEILKGKGAVGNR